MRSRLMVVSHAAKIEFTRTQSSQRDYCEDMRIQITTELVSTPIEAQCYLANIPKSLVSSRSPPGV